MLWNCVKLSISFTLSLKYQISNSAVLYSDSDNRIWAWRKGNYLSSLVEQLSVCKRHFSMFNRPLVDFLQRFTVLTRQMPLDCSIMIPPHCLSAQKIVEGAGNFSSLPTKKFLHWYLSGQCHPQNELWRGFHVALLLQSVGNGLLLHNHAKTIWRPRNWSCHFDLYLSKWILQLQPRSACLPRNHFSPFWHQGQKQKSEFYSAIHCYMVLASVTLPTYFFFNSTVLYPISPVWKDLFKTSKNYTL